MKASDISYICQGPSMRARISDLQFNREFMAWIENIQPTVSILVDKTSNNKMISFRIVFQEYVLILFE